MPRKAKPTKADPTEDWQDPDGLWSPEDDAEAATQVAASGVAFPPYVVRRVDELIPYVRNARTHSDEQVAMIAASIREFGFTNPVLLDGNRGIVAGHGRVLAARKLGMTEVPCLELKHLTRLQVKAYVLADNQLALKAGWDEQLLKIELEELIGEDFKLDLLGFEPADLDEIFGPDDTGDGSGDGAAEPTNHGALSDRFGVPPFSVLNAREGWWQDRKRAWIALGIRSEAGRAGLQSTTNTSDGKYEYMSGRGTRDGGSIFDPVLCELAYRWFSPPGAVVVDPFSGGSVRGVVAALLGRKYRGFELRPEQVEANRQQWAAIVARGGAPEAQDPDPVSDPEALTPIQQVGDHWLKRDDLFVFNGVPGGKVRTCLALARAGQKAGAEGLVTAGSRASPQVNIVAHVGQALGMRVRCHTPTGELSPEVKAAQAVGAEIIQHKAGYNTVIVKRARDDAAALGWAEIPFGMECAEAVRQTRRQVANLPAEVTRIVMPCGSGMSLAGVLHGLDDAGRRDVKVRAVVVGADPTDRLNEYAPRGWRERVELVPSGSDYHDPAPVTSLAGVQLDPHYEAKCLPYLEPGDLLWVVGIRATADRTAAPALGIRLPTSGPAGERWKVSAKWLSKRHDCTLAGIKAKCGGACCHGPSYWPGRAYKGPDNPTHACGNLGPQGCVLSPDDKPITCLLYPVVLNENRTLVLHHRTQFETSCCKGNAGNGPVLIEALGDNLTSLFGREQYERVKADVLAGRDSYFDASPHVVAALAREQEWDRASAPPEPRSGFAEADEAAGAPAVLGDFPTPEWVQGDSAQTLPAEPEDFQADFLLTCPPYGDLEVYSDDPADLSNMDHAAFLEGYRTIIAAAVARLRSDRFAVCVVGDFRDSRGLYRNFVSDTIDAFQRAGAMLYNEAILVTPAGSVPLRAGGHFLASRKLSKVHQNCLVFVKGDFKRATEACGPCDFGDLGEAEGEAPPEAEGEDAKG